MAEKPNKKQADLQKQINSLYKQGSISLSEMTAMMGDLNRMTDGQIKNSLNHLENLAKQNKALKDQKTTVDAIAKSEGKLIDLTKKLQDGVSGNLDAFKGITGETRGIVLELQAMYKQQLAQGKITKDEFKDRAKINMELLKTAKTMDTIASNNVLAAAFEDTMSTLDGISDRIAGMFNKIPGGNMLFKYLGGEDLKANMRKAGMDGMAAVGKSMKGGASATQALTAGVKQFGKSLMAMPKMPQVLAIAAAIALVAALAAAVAGIFKLLKSITQEALKFTEATGVSVAQSKELVMQSKALQTSQSNLLATSQEILDVQKAFVQEYGRADIIAGETALKLANIGKAFGYSSAEAAEVNSVLTTIGGASQESAANMQIFAAKMAESMGVAPGRVMKDLAKNGDLLADSMAGNAEAMIKTAAAAAAVGLDIEKMVKMTNSLLDIENSLTAQMEFQAISGKQINMEEARRHHS